MKLKKSTQIIVGVLAGLTLVGILSSRGDKTNDAKKDLKEAMIAEATPTKESATIAETSDAISTADEEKSLFNSGEEFKTAFNNFCQENSFALEIDDLKSQEGKVNNTFSYMFTANLGIVGTLNKANGTVKEISMIGKGDGTATSGADIMTCMAGIIGTVDPSLKAKQRGEILDKLGLFDKGVDFKDHSASTDKNGIHYYINCSELMGIVFGASKK
jgi:hypothetical protein